MTRTLRLAYVFSALIANLIPLYGALYWQWDAFHLLMLYWTETVIIAFWTILGITRLPIDQLGTITVNGRPRPATHNSLCGYFTLVASLFILGHLLFLWMIFSGPWLQKVSGISNLLHLLFVADGLWLALSFMVVSGWMTFLNIAPSTLPRGVERAPAPEKTSGSISEAGSEVVGAVVGGLFARIAIMQIAIIFGAMLAKTYDSMAPLLILIGCKALVEVSVASRSAPSFKGMTTH